MEESIFTKIIQGEIPSHKIYEDEKTLAFLDIHPVQAGQTVVVPKKQVNFVWDLDSENYQALMTTVQKVGQRLRAAFPEKKRVSAMIVGLDIDNHAHVVLIPIDSFDEFHKTPDMNTEPDHPALAELAKKLAF